MLSQIHSITADFLTDRLKNKGFPDFASSHGNILFQLSVHEKMTMGDLAEKINRDKSTTTVLVRKLEKDGFITGDSDPADKRSRIIYLTEKGNQFNTIAQELSKELLETFYKDFTIHARDASLWTEKISKNFRFQAYEKHALL